MSRFTLLVRGRFHAAEDAHQVTAEDALDLCFRVAAVDKPLSDVWKIADILKLLGHDADAIEIGAQADVLNASHLGDVVDMIQEIVNRAARIGMLPEPASH